LQETLGQRLVAFAVGIKDPKAEETPATTRAWMIGANPQLNDEAPIEALHQKKTAAVMRAAEAFVLGG